MSQQLMRTINSIVASYLTQQGYTDSLAAFRLETSPIEPNLTTPDLRELVEEYLAKQKASLAVPPPAIEEELKKLQITARIPDSISQTLRESTNVLSVNDWYVQDSTTTTVAHSSAALSRNDRGIPFKVDSLRQFHLPSQAVLLP